MKELHESLIEAEKQVFEQERLQREMNELKEEGKVLHTKEQSFLKKLNEEKEDVEKLKRMSLTNMFVTLTGQKLERMEKEEKEVMEARLKWREAYESLQDVKKEIGGIDERIQQLGDPKKDFETLYLRKKEFLMNRGKEKGQRLMELNEKRSLLQAELLEIREAVSAGKHAMEALEKATSSLSAAKNWGALDMLGGGLLTTAVKHSRIDEADSAIHSAQRHLRKFANELKDLDEHYQADINISGSLTVADYFFDGLIVDWFVQNRIQSSNEEVKEIQRKTHRALFDLESLQRQVEQEEEKFKSEQDRILGIS